MKKLIALLALSFVAGSTAFADSNPCVYGNDMFISGPENGVPAQVYSRQSSDFDKYGVIQFCNRPDQQGSYVLLIGQGSVRGDGRVDQVTNPPQEILSSSVLASGETKIDVNTSHLKYGEVIGSELYLLISADGQALQVFVSNPNISAGKFILKATLSLEQKTFISQLSLQKPPPYKCPPGTHSCTADLIKTCCVSH